MWIGQTKFLNVLLNSQDIVHQSIFSKVRKVQLNVF